MFSAMHFITYNETLSDSDAQAVSGELQELASAISPIYLFGTPLEGSSNGGSVVLRLGFDSQSAYESAKASSSWTTLQELLSDRNKIAGVEFGAYDAGVFSVDNPGATDCIHRVLMFADRESAKKEDVAMLDSLFTQFHKYVPILNWHVAKVIESSGTKQWAHIWEQDFESLDIFFGPYMFTPFHPTYVDTFFDTECPNWTADPYLCSMVCTEEKAFLANLALN